MLLITATFLRVYKVGETPPSASWDEAAVGYNAFAITNWGKDEWGKTFPLVFKSFEDDKHPVHVYFTAFAVKIFGLSDFSTRLAPALFGVFNVVLIFYLGKILFNSSLLGLIAAAFLTFSPYNIQFSRFNHEANFALAFFMLGLLSFLHGIRGRRGWFNLTAVSFGISILSYQSSVVFVPLMIFVLAAFYHRKLWEIRKTLIVPTLIFSLFILMIIFNPALLGFARLKQNALPAITIESTPVFKSTKSELLSHLYLSLGYYLSHFDYKYLFVSGDPIPRHSTQVIGEFFWIDAILLPIGLLALLFKRTKESFLILLWAFLAPIPSSFSPGANGWGHAARALFTMGSWHLISAYGLFQLLKLLKIRLLKIGLVLLVAVAIGYQFTAYIKYYYESYGRDQAIEWQYGFKQVAEYIKDHPEYHTVYVTDIRSQPYIFLLYYLKFPLPQYLDTVYGNTGHTRPSNLVARFDKFIFANWDPIESQLQPGVLYVVGPSAYDGLRYRDQFQVKKLVRYPNGTDAFFLVSSN